MLSCDGLRAFKPASDEGVAAMKVGFLASWQRARSLFTWLVLSLIAATARAANTQQGSKECIRSALPRVYTRWVLLTVPPGLPNAGTQE